MKLFLVAVLLCLSSAPLCGQALVEDRYFRDFDVLVQHLVEIHPDPYSRFGGRVEFFRVMQTTRAELKSVSTDDEFVVRVNRFLAALGDGHTLLYPPASARRHDAAMLPVRFKASADGLFVSAATAQYESLVGLPLLAVDDMRLDELLEVVRRTYPVENISGAYARLAQLLRNTDGYHALVDQGTAAVLSLQADDREIRQTVPFGAGLVLLPPRSLLEVERDNDLLYWALVGRNHDIGYLRWSRIISREMVEHVAKHSPSWLDVNVRAAYEAMGRAPAGTTDEDISAIPSVYESMLLLLEEMAARGSSQLIIDLRDTPGGFTPLGISLAYMLYPDRFVEHNPTAQHVRRLSRQYLEKIGMSIENYNRATQRDLRTGEYAFDHFYGSLVNRSPEERRRVAESGWYGFGARYIRQAVLLERPALDVLVLTSPGTFSAAYHVAHLLSEVGGARTVGVAPRQAGNAFMEMTEFMLPETKLRGSISNAQQVFFPGDPGKGELLRPDFEMKWGDFKAFAFDPNAELLHAIRLIEGPEHRAAPGMTSQPLGPGDIAPAQPTGLR